MSDELAILNKPTISVEFEGEQVTFTPVPMGNMQEFTAVVRPIANDLMMALEGENDLLTTIELHGNRMIEAVQIATGIDRARLDACMADEFVKLARAVIEVNYDFFAQRLLPSIRAAVTALREKAQAAGTTQFSA